MEYLLGASASGVPVRVADDDVIMLKQASSSGVYVDGCSYARTLWSERHVRS